MENKKKCHGGLKVLLLLLFGMLFVMPSTCFARTTLTDDEAEYIYNYLFNTNIDYNLYYNLNSHEQYHLKEQTKYNGSDGVEIFKQFFNQNNDLNIYTDTTVFWSWNYSLAGAGVLFYGNFNNGKQSGYPHLYLEFSDENVLNFYAIDDNHNKLTYEINVISFSSTNNSLEFTNLRNSTLSSNSARTFYWINKPINWNSSNLSNDRAVLENISGLVTFSNTNSIYTNYNGITFFNEPVSRLLQTLYTGQQDLNPVPSGDIVPDTGNTGQITNNSGETTGNIDLSGIQNGIGNINQSINEQGQAIIENQNQNTNTIVNTISGEVEKITNTLTDNADNIIDNTIINSGDIANTVDFSIINNNQNYNAYTNFWYNLTIGFSDSMTNVVRTLPVEFRGQTYLVNLDDFTVFIPNALKVFLGIISSVFVCLYITRESKHIVEDIQTASIDNVANKLTEDFETNMF